ncbi:MAG: HIT domain-containing protein [Thermomicrobiales bacterium]|nr:HIT domain-containing protein [Thermomicrobiales bacterium]
MDNIQRGSALSLKTVAFNIGRRIGKHPLASRVFYLSERFLPVERLARSEHVAAFRHPRPSWIPHILIVPTTPFPELVTSKLSLERKSEILGEMLALAQQVAATEDTDASWFVIINGGIRQEIGQVHGHLIHEPHDVGEPTHSIATANGWKPLLETLQRANEVPDNGYSLVILLDQEIAWVSESQ